ncbi:MAG TPA: Mrp/NBP35 family ATP-binding protein [bacterium]|nr:Mrp/NBP35 family ATP-binding protein [bacterium]
MIKNTILVMSGKGGVGKTTVAVNLAAWLVSSGTTTGLLDVDIHGPNVPLMAGVSTARLQVENEKITPVVLESGLRVMSIAFLLENADSSIIWRGPMKHNVIKQFVEDVAWGDLDYLVIDFPPGTGDECISAAQLIPSGRSAVIVSSPQQVSLLDCRKSIDFCRQFQIPVIGLIENMSGELFGEGSVAALAAAQGVPFLGSLSMDRSITLAGDSGEPFVLGTSPAATRFQDIATRISLYCEEKK